VRFANAELWSFRGHDEESCWQKRRRKIRRHNDRYVRRNIIRSLIKLVRYRPTDNSSVTTNFMSGNQQPRIVSCKTPPWETRCSVAHESEAAPKRKVYNSSYQTLVLLLAQFRVHVYNERWFKKFMIPKRRNTFGSETYLVFQTDCLVTEKKNKFQRKAIYVKSKIFYASRSIQIFVFNLCSIYTYRFNIIYVWICYEVTQILCTKINTKI